MYKSDEYYKWQYKSNEELFSALKTFDKVFNNDKLGNAIREYAGRNSDAIGLILVERSRSGAYL